MRVDVLGQDDVAARLFQAGARGLVGLRVRVLSGAFLRACAELCGVSLKTSWFMRMRPCEVMARATQPFRTGGAVSWQADGTYLSESLKGNRSRSALGMPRGAHRPCASAVYRPSRPACVCGANDLATRSAGEPGAAGPPTPSSRRRWGGLGPCERVSTDGHAGYARVLPGLGAGAHEAAPAPGTGPSLGMVNALHQRLKHFLGRFAGVSTRWLFHYLAWFRWAEQARRYDENTWSMLVSAPQPFWDYWEGRAAMSTVV